MLTPDTLTFIVFAVIVLVVTFYDEAQRKKTEKTKSNTEEVKEDCSDTTTTNIEYSSEYQLVTTVKVEEETKNVRKETIVVKEETAPEYIAIVRGFNDFEKRHQSAKIERHDNMSDWEAHLKRWESNFMAFEARYAV